LSRIRSAGAYLLILAAVILPGCGEKTVEPADPAAKKGAVLFREMACATCHQPGATGGALDGVTRRRKPDWFAVYLKDPAAVHPESMMPQYELPSEDVDALWAYLSWRDR
jgi:mono/diheme cytochrome c family protein